MSNGNVIAIVYGGGPSATSPTQANVEANARFIAAAPRLFDAGKELLRVLDMTEYGNLEAVAELRAAIAAAEPEVQP